MHATTEALDEALDEVDRPAHPGVTTAWQTLARRIRELVVQSAAIAVALRHRGGRGRKRTIAQWRVPKAPPPAGSSPPPSEPNPTPRLDRAAHRHGMKLALPAAAASLGYIAGRIRPLAALEVWNWQRIASAPRPGWPNAVLFTFLHPVRTAHLWRRRERLGVLSAPAVAARRSREDHTC